MKSRKIFTICLLLVSINLFPLIAFSSSEKIQITPAAWAEDLEARKPQAAAEAPEAVAQIFEPKTEVLEVAGSSSNIQSTITQHSLTADLDYDFELVLEAGILWIYIYVDSIFVTKIPLDE